MPKTLRFATEPAAGSMFFPFVGRRHPSKTGIPLGPELTGRRLVHLAPWQWHKDGLVPNATCEMSADINAGKSTLAKGAGLEFCGLPEPTEDGPPKHVDVLYNDRRSEKGKGEYAVVVEEAGGYNFPLHEYSFNPFLPVSKSVRLNITQADTLEIAVGLAENVKGSGGDYGVPITADEALAFQIGVNRMTRSQIGSSPKILEHILRTLNGDVIKEYFESGDKALYDDLLKVHAERPELIKELHIAFEAPAIDRYEDLEKAAFQAANYMNAVTGPRFGNLFGGNMPIDGMFGKRLSSRLWEGLTPHVTSAANSLFMQYESIAIRDQAWHFIPRVSFTDEVATRMNDPFFARSREERARMTRRSKEAAFTLTQYCTDTATSGTAGSEMRKHGEAIHNTIGYRIIGHQPGTPAIKEMLSSLGFKDPDIDYITGDLPPRCFALKLPDQDPVFFKYVIGPKLEALVGTNSQSEIMTQTVNPLDDPETAARLQRINGFTTW